MIGRAFTVIALIAALLLGANVRNVCAQNEQPVSCTACCKMGASACCEVGAKSDYATPLTADRVAPVSTDPLVAPQLVQIALVAAGEIPITHPHFADIAFTHYPPLVAQTCIRLI